MSDATGKLIVISGPSGAGKSTVITELLLQDHNIYFSVSATTREIRPSEVEGVDYYFVKKREFEQMIAGNELLEYAEYVGNYYGTPLKAVDNMLQSGRDVLLDIEVQGAFQIKKRRKDAILIFLVPPSLTELERRLRIRGDVEEEIINKRLETARWEYKQAEKYDYIALNSSIESAVNEIRSIIMAEKCRIHHRISLLEAGR